MYLVMHDCQVFIMCAMLKTLRRKSTLGNIAAVNVVFVDIPSGKSHVLPSKVSPFQDMKLGMGQVLF